VPMEVRSWVISVGNERKNAPVPAIAMTYPAPHAIDVAQDVVPKLSFSAPVTNLESATFTLADSAGHQVPAWVDQIGEGTWGLFPHAVFLTAGETYTARVSAGVCDYSGSCTKQPIAWSFTISPRRGEGAGDTTVPLGFPRAQAARADSSATRGRHAERNGGQ